MPATHQFKISNLKFKTNNGFTMFTRTKRGFTLVELLVVIAIIAILSVVGVTIFTNVQENARDAKRRSDLHAIANALIQYQIQRGFYPPGGNVGSAGFGPCPISIGSFDNGCDAAQNEIAAYMVSIPGDPLDSTSNKNCGSGQCYSYHTPDAAHSSYCLCATLDNPPAAGKPSACNIVPGNYCIMNSL